MLNDIKQLIILKSVDRLISNKNYESALDTLNSLIKSGFRLNETYLKRGDLCQQLLMPEDAYSDYTYVITHCKDKYKAYEKRMNLNFDIGNYDEAILDANEILASNQENYNSGKIIFLSYVFSNRADEAKEYALLLFNNNRFKVIQFILNETAISITKDELAKGLKLLEIIELIDSDNPMKLLKEANIYALAGDTEKQDELLRKIDSVFPKYFISHFKFTDIYEQRDLLEICFLIELKIFDRQNLFAYPLTILEGYKCNMEGHIIDSKECFEKAIGINPAKAEAYVLLAETLQLMSGYNNPELQTEAEKNYRIALEIYERENLPAKAETMKRQIKHLNSGILFGK